MSSKSVMQSILEGLHDSRMNESVKKNGKEIECPKCGSTNVVVREDGTYYCKECDLVFTDEDLKSDCISEGNLVGDNVKVTLKDMRGISYSIRDLIELGNRYNFGENEFMNVIRDCKRSPKDIANALNNENDWIAARFETMGDGKGTDSGCTLKVTDPLKNKYVLSIKY